MTMVRYTLALLALTLVLGTTSFTLAQAPHPDKGPHGGPLVEWGEEEYHLEVVPDKKGGVAVYILDGEAKKAKPINAKELVLSIKSTPPVVVKLTAVAEKGDPEGKFSKYVGKNDIFTKEMKLAGSVFGKVGNKPYAGDFKQK